jgi:hypothetical protein
LVGIIAAIVGVVLTAVIITIVLVVVKNESKDIGEGI